VDWDKKNVTVSELIVYS